MDDEAELLAQRLSCNDLRFRRRLMERLDGLNLAHSAALFLLDQILFRVGLEENRQALAETDVARNYRSGRSEPDTETLRRICADVEKKRVPFRPSPVPMWPNVWTSNWDAHSEFLRHQSWTFLPRGRDED